MMPTVQGPPGSVAATELVAASLITSAAGAELQLVARDGRRLRLPTNETAAREAAIALWLALDRRE